MEPVSLEGLPENALLLVDSAPIIYVLEDHPDFARAFRPVFVAHEKGLARFAVTTMALAEVLTGPVSKKDEVLTEKYRACGSAREYTRCLCRTTLDLLVDKFLERLW